MRSRLVASPGLGATSSKGGCVKCALVISSGLKERRTTSCWNIGGGRVHANKSIDGQQK